MLFGPNKEVIEAQKWVCTGPNQSRPLTGERGSPDPNRILSLILKTVAGELIPDQTVSYAQIGAFFAAMCIRRTFGESCKSLLQKRTLSLLFLICWKNFPGD